LIFGNLVIVFWGIIGTFAVWYVNLVAALAFFIVAAVLVYGLLRKKCCKTCYYCKTCTVGFGKLPELFFRRNGTENVDSAGLKLFPFVYLYVGFVPIAAAMYSIIQDYSITKVVLLILLIALALYTGIIRRKMLLNKNK
jgi:uncharacterized membrane protein YoaK (UPF0700 family)